MCRKGAFQNIQGNREKRAVTGTELSRELLPELPRGPGSPVDRRSLSRVGQRRRRRTNGGALIDRPRGLDQCPSQSTEPTYPGTSHRFEISHRLVLKWEEPPRVPSSSRKPGYGYTSCTPPLKKYPLRECLQDLLREAGRGQPPVSFSRTQRRQERGKNTHTQKAFSVISSKKVEGGRGKFGTKAMGKQPCFESGVRLKW